jgi:hypothetical protein
MFLQIPVQGQEIMYSSANHRRVSPRGKPLNIQEKNRWGIKGYSATQSIALWNIGGATDIGGRAWNSGVEEWCPQVQYQRLTTANFHTFQQALKSGSGPGGRWFKSTRPDDSFQ